MAGLQDSAGDADLEQILGVASDWRQRLSTEDEALPALAELIKQVQLTSSGLRLTVNLPVVKVGAVPGAQIALSHFVPMKMRRRAVELRLIVDGKAEESREVDQALVKALARARAWFEEVTSGRVGSLAEIARRQGLRKRYVARLTKLAFIAPSIAEAIIAGRAPIGVNLQMLMDGRLELTPCWTEQQQVFSGLNSRP